MNIQFKHKPCKSTRITSPFGPRWGSFHDGVDIGALTPGVDGDELYAVADGTVVVSKVNNGGINVGYGNYIVIQHEGFCTLYGHMQKLGLPVGTKVKAGDVIGYMGNTGSSTGTHVHFRVAKGNYNSKFFSKDSNGITMGSIDPEPYLNNIKGDKKTWLQELGEQAIKELDIMTYDGGKDLVNSPERWINALGDEKVLNELGIKNLQDLLAFQFLMLSRIAKLDK